MLVADAISGPDTVGDGDYYARVRIGSAPFERNRTAFREGRDLNPFWQFTRVVPENDGTVPIVVQIWDADPIENNDDIIVTGAKVGARPNGKPAYGFRNPQNRSGPASWTSYVAPACPLFCPTYDIIDLNPQDNSQDLVLTLDLSDCTWSGDVGQNGTFSSGDGDGEHFGAAEGGERGHVSFGIACSDGDFDDDGIPDAIERFGIRDREGTLVADMAALGADPCRKTIAVEIDSRPGAGPSAADLQQLRDSFDDAPIDAPAGTCRYPDFAPVQRGVDLLTVVSDTNLPNTGANDQGDQILEEVLDAAQASPGETVRGFNDWRNLIFRTAMVPAAGAPAVVEANEPRPEDAIVMQNVWGRHLRCGTPDSGDRVIVETCTIWRDTRAPGDVTVPSDVVLTIGKNVRLDLNLAEHTLRVQTGGRLELQAGARID